MDLAFWSDEFVGAGPYRLKEWVRGSHLVLTANDSYILGKPKIDELTIKFILDRNALAASLLGGDVDIPIGNTLSFEEGMALREQWKDGSVELVPTTTLKIWPQFRNPSPAVVGNVRFRKALMHALDRQQMADGLSLGQSSVSDSTLAPTDPEYEALKGSIVRYGYDARAAADLITSLGYHRGPDEMWRDATGQPLQIEVRTVPRDALIKAVLSAADDWKRLGVTVDPMVLTAQQRSDPEFYATFPAFDAAASNNGTAEFFAFHSSQAKLPENRYAGSNRSSYTNAELDGLIDAYFTTIPTSERMQVAGRIVNHVTDQVVFFPLYYDLSPTISANRIINVPKRLGRAATPTWNAHLWDLKG
jgi:peptide/nickel transport system substrate-binding protein